MSTTKKVGILPLSLRLLERSRLKFYTITLSPFPIPLPSFVQFRLFFEEIILIIINIISEKFLQTHCNISVRPIGFSPTINSAGKIYKLYANYSLCLQHSFLYCTNLYCLGQVGRSNNKKAQLSLTNPRNACEKFARFT